MSLDRLPPGGSSRAEWVRVQWERHGNIALVACVLAAVLLLATLRWPGELRLSGRLVAGAVTIVLDDELQIEPDLDLDRGEVRLSGLQMVQPPAEIATEVIEATSLTLRAKRITLSGMHLGAGTELTLDSGARASTWLAVGRAAGSLDFEAQGPLCMTIGNKSFVTSVSNPLALSAQREGSSAIPLSLSGGHPHELSFHDLPTAPTISLIRFGRQARTSDFGATFISTVVSGAIQMVDVDRDVKLDRGAWVIIDKFRGHLFELEQTASGYSIGFSGTAGDVRTGPAGFADDLTPSCLAYLYHQEWIKLMWAAALGGFAALAKVRSWLGGKFD